MPAGPALDAIDALTEAILPTQEQRKKKANDLKNSSSAKQKEKEDVRKLLDKKPKKAKKKKPPSLEKAPLGALKGTDKKSELAPIGKATSPEVSKKEPTRTGDEADRPPSAPCGNQMIGASLLDGVEDTLTHTGRARATSSRRPSPRRIPTSRKQSTRPRRRSKVY